jgi:hypothetical protein
MLRDSASTLVHTSRGTTIPTPKVDSTMCENRGSFEGTSEGNLPTENNLPPEQVE